MKAQVFNSSTLITAPDKDKSGSSSFGSSLLFMYNNHIIDNVTILRAGLQ